MTSVIAQRTRTVGSDPLIESDSVEGRNVYGARDNCLGVVRRLVIDEVSGRVLYVVVASEGFLGFGERLYSVEWQHLSYDTGRQGFKLGADCVDMVTASANIRRRHPDWTDRENKRLHRFQITSFVTNI